MGRDEEGRCRLGWVGLSMAPQGGARRGEVVRGRAGRGWAGRVEARRGRGGKLGGAKRGLAVPCSERQGEACFLPKTGYD